MHGVSLSPSLDQAHSSTVLTHTGSQWNGQRKFQGDEQGLYQECLVLVINGYWVKRS